MSSTDNVKIPEPIIKKKFDSIQPEKKPIAGAEKKFIDQYYSKRFISDYLTSTVRRK